MRRTIGVAIIHFMVEGRIVRGVALAGLVAAMVSAPAPGAEVPPNAGAPGREELLGEIRRLDAQIRELRSLIDQLRNAIPPQASAVVTVPAGARQAAPFNLPAPSFGPSDWIPTWPPMRNPSPQARERTPTELGAEAPPLAPSEPFDFPRFVPGKVVVEHGLGPSDVTVKLSVLNPDGSESLEVNPNRIAVRGSGPPDGTFTILNYTEYPVTVRWVAQRPTP